MMCDIAKVILYSIMFVSYEHSPCESCEKQR